MMLDTGLGSRSSTHAYDVGLKGPVAFPLVCREVLHRADRGCQILRLSSRFSARHLRMNMPWQSLSFGCTHALR